MNAPILTGSKQGAPRLQDDFLDELQKNQTTVSVYLVNGIRLVGTIDGFDAFIVVLANSTKQMIYKHAVSTIVPGEPQRNVTRLHSDADGNVRKHDELGMSRRNRPHN